MWCLRGLKFFHQSTVIKLPVIMVSGDHQEGLWCFTEMDKMNWTPLNRIPFLKKQRLLHMCKKPGSQDSHDSQRRKSHTPARGNQALQTEATDLEVWSQITWGPQAKEWMPWYHETRHNDPTGTKMSWRQWRNCPVCTVLVRWDWHQITPQIHLLRIRG